MGVFRTRRLVRAALLGLGVVVCSVAATPAGAGSASSAVSNASNAGNVFNGFYCPLLSAPAGVRPVASAAVSGKQPAFKRGLPYREAPVLPSRNGVLKVTLRVARGPVSISGARVTAYTYNGLFAGPTMLINVGDRIEVTLINRLSEPTNFHFHGMHVSPSGNSDDVFLHVLPGETQRYSVKVGAGNQPGTYWYHSHMHELSEHQVLGGLSGLIIIDGARKHLGRALAGIAERTIALKHIQVINGATPTDDNAIKMGADQPGYPAPNVRLVDGLLLPTLKIRPGEVQLWHIANIGADAFYKLALDGSRFLVLSQDANSLDHPRAVTSLLIPPGNRFDVLVVGPKAGVTRLRTLSYAQGDATFPERILATLRSAGPRETTPRMPTRFLHFDRLDSAPIAEHRTFTFDEGGTGINFHFLINQEVFDPNRVDVRAKLGTTEEWTLINTTPSDHPFHIHVDNFQIMSMNGIPYHARNVQDTGIIPKHSRMVIRIAFDDFVGKFVFHCHILGHEDLGMMKTIEVYKDPKSPLTVAPRSPTS